MLYKTRGIVLSYIKYKETSIIAKIYTEDFGIQSYIINSVRSRKSRKGMALVQPLSILGMVVYFKKEKADGLQRIAEYKAVYSFSAIPFEIKKSSIALFITELLSKTLKDTEDQGDVFEFLVQLILALDHRRQNYESLHLYLMVQLTHHLGFGICSVEQLKKDNIIPAVSSPFDEIYQLVLTLNTVSLIHEVTISNLLRRDTLGFMVEYYRLHIEGFKEMKSLNILLQLFG